MPLRFAEGEETDASGRPVGDESAALLDLGHRCMPDGSEFNVARLHRIFSIQMAVADEAAKRTIRCMLDEHVVFVLRNTFFDPSEPGAESDPQRLVHGRSSVLKYLTTEGFGVFGGKRTQTAAAKSRNEQAEGVAFAQPVALTAAGDTRTLLSAGDRSACGSAKDRLRIGLQLTFDQWGLVTRVLHVLNPQETHYEWTSYFHTGNFASVRRLLDDAVVFYSVIHHPLKNGGKGVRQRHADSLAPPPRRLALLHTRAPRSPPPRSPPPGTPLPHARHPLPHARHRHAHHPHARRRQECTARAFRGAKDVFDQFEFEIARTKGHISVISPDVTGQALERLMRHWTDVGSRSAARSARSAASDATAAPQGSPSRRSALKGDVCPIEEAMEACVSWTRGGESRSGSTLCFGGRWLPVGVAARDYGVEDSEEGLTVCVRETIGWVHDGRGGGSGGGGGKDGGKSQRRARMLCREIFCHKKPGELHLDPPPAPGFNAAWRMAEKRRGKDPK